jgi:hypothetical protein
MVQTKNRVSGLLLETGVEHTKSRLHKVGYFRRLMQRVAHGSQPHSGRDGLNRRAQQ